MSSEPRSDAQSDARHRALLSRGQSADAIHRRAVEALLARAGARDGAQPEPRDAARTPAQTLAVDVGCGTGSLRALLQPHYARYLGVDVIRHAGYPADAPFVQADLDANSLPLEQSSADAVFALETIEHVENPRAFMRELVRILKPGGWLAVTTPNQLSLLSKATLLVRNEFNAFGRRDYPAHITALLEIDLLRIATECGLAQAAIEYSRSGRIALTGRRFPEFVSRAFPRAFSDNVILIARKPGII